MFARVGLCFSLLIAAPAAAQTAPSALLDELFAVARFEENLDILRDAALADWRDTGDSVLSAADDPDWEAASLSGTDPSQIAADFRHGFLTVPFPEDQMRAAIADLQTPFGQRLTQIGLEAATRLAQAETLAGDFAAAELTNSPRVVAADRLVELRGTVETHMTFLYASEEAYFLGLNDLNLSGADLTEQAAADVQAYMADWSAYFEDIRPDITLAYRQLFFLLSEDFTPDELTRWITRAEQPWAQSFEAAFQAGYREAYRQSMFRQGQAVAAYDLANESGE